jgi:Domain of unknown function (DUF6089)
LKKIVFILVMLPLFSLAQVRHHEMGIFGGTANYYGDLQKKFFPNNSYRPVGGLMYKYFTHPRFGVRFGASYSELTAADSLSEITSDRLRNLNFTTNLFELHGGFELNMLNCDPEFNKFTPYIFGGLSLFYFNPYTGDLNDNKVYLKPLSTEGQGLPAYIDRKPYNLVGVAMPFGGGLKILFGKKVFVTAELGMRLTFTDYIDDVSKSYVNMDTLFQGKGLQSVDLSFRNDELKTDMRNIYPNYKFQRGDKNPNDWYWFGGLGITVYFDSFGNLWPYRQTRCPRKKNIF